MSALLTPATNQLTQANPGSWPPPGRQGHEVETDDRFVHRHLGPRPEDIRQMLSTLGFPSLAALADAAVPKSIRLTRPLDLPAPQREAAVLAQLRAIAGKNQVFRSLIGMGHYGCLTPTVIQRNVLENPGWYTPYTPYQAEIAQGRLEGLLNFQTMVCDLTGLGIANASLLDEATAAAEAMTMCHRLKGGNGRNRFLVAATCHPQNIAVVQTRAQALGLEVLVTPPEALVLEATVFGVLVQYPATHGLISEYQALAEQVHAAGALLVVATDLLSLTLLRPPGEFGADVAVGNSQRFGVPLGYGGPHAAFLATREEFKRQMPGRLVGVSQDARGRPALRLALGTREQHIRREKATSNICTAQALLANLAAMYAVYHGPAGLTRIARRVHQLTAILAAGLKRLGCQTGDQPFFDTLQVGLGAQRSADLVRIAQAHRINLRVMGEQQVGISLDELSTLEEVNELFQIFNHDTPAPFSAETLAGEVQEALPPALARSTPFLTHPVFHRHPSETEMLRYLRRLEARDLSLTTAMIPLGSCTMKLNPTTAMQPVSWPEFSQLHPYAPLDQAQGYQVLFQQLERWLAEITGFAAISLQPNAGSQGEYAGLLAIRAYHARQGQSQRKVCLIPQSAHGTNPASAVMAGLKVIVIACDKEGNIDVSDLKAKAEAHQHELAALMVTYPSTHGVFEADIKAICAIVHACGGLVYMDGANLNAQVGLCRPAEIGADVCHLNLHKTFGIPHGGGGPGMGPIGVASHLAACLPGHSVVPSRAGQALGAVAAAPWGSASILPIAWVYIAALGAAGLTEATQVAILNANYVARRLEPYYPVLYKGPGGWVAHECILDLRQIRRGPAPPPTGGSPLEATDPAEPPATLLPVSTITVEDVAKRLMDYGFHAPTISWPVPGTMMVEPTESESLSELDRFCEALIAIHAEILAIETGPGDKQNNLLKNAPHTADMLAADPWPHPYSRAQAAYPVPGLRDHKFWPFVGRVDNVYGDRNLVCACGNWE